MANQFPSKILTLQTLREDVRKAEYAVRGDVLIRAQQLEKALNRGESLNFTEFAKCNIGNPQLLGQKPLTWIRQGLSLLISPDLLLIPEVLSNYPSDVIERANFLLSKVKGGVGAYSESQGLSIVRESVAKYIGKRDLTPPPEIENIFLSAGASPAVDTILTCLISTKKHGIMVPIPQYPLYSALITLKQGHQVGYYIEETEDSYWKLSIEQMQQAYDKATQEGIVVNCIVVINPGNPTGQVLSIDELRKIVEFAQRNKLVILADEVYQDNVYMHCKEFCSLRKIVLELGTEAELFSFHSLSKGFFGECGLRGGYMELLNIDAEVKAQILKLASIKLCPNTIGQLGLELALNPPDLGMPSYEKFLAEKTTILDSLKRKSQIMYEMLNSMDNIHCNYVEGAMYAMPSVKFSQKAIQAAKDLRMPADKFYALQALENTGIIIVPGSGFGQQPGTYHFRITILSPESSIVEMLEKFKAFNDFFHQQYKD